MSDELKCPECPVTRPTRSSLAYHITATHQGPEVLPDRADTVGARLEQAGRGIADLKRQVDELARQHGTPDPRTVKQRVIREIWCQLMDAGHTDAARLVRANLDSL